MQQPQHNSTTPTQRGDTARSVFVPIAFILVALFLWSGTWTFVNPVEAGPDVQPWVNDIATVRHPTLRPEVRIGAFVYNCRECHDLFKSKTGKISGGLAQHRHIVLKHGINDNCFTCHHPTQRDAYVDYDGNPIPADLPQLLCAKCHGPVYRDWTHGVHGRTNGYWDAEQGPVERKKCIECHDPHIPPFPPMRPAPGPRTLRMGEQAAGHGHEEAEQNPLLIYRQNATDRYGETTNHE